MTDIEEQRNALREGQRDVAERQHDVSERQRDIAVSELFEEDLQRNIDGAQGRLDHPGADGEEGPTVPPGPDTAGHGAELPT